MDMGFIESMMQHMKGSGLRGRRREKEKLSSKVEVYLKANLKMILSMDMEKCIIILLETFSKVNGLKILRKEQEQ